MNIPVPPTPPSSTVLQTTAPTATSTGTIVQSATSQTPLQLGQTLAATVLNRVAPGQFLLQSDSGQLTLQTAANLLNGSTLNLQVLTAGARPQVLIVPLPGQNRTPQTANALTAPAITSTLTQGSIASATVLRPVPFPTPPLSQGIPGPTGETIGAASGATSVSGKITQSTAADAPTIRGAARPGVASTSGSAPVPRTSLSGSTSTGGSSQTTVLPSGSTFNVRIISVVPVGSGAPLAFPDAQGVLTGTVTGTTPTGQTIVRPPLGEIALSARSTLPRGTQLNLHMMGTPKFPMGTGDTSSLLLSQQWETLKDAMAAILSSDPAVARNMTQQILPQAGGPMTTGMLFFLSAMMTGDLRRWMGEEAMRILQRSGGNLLDRLRQDIGEMQRMANEPSGREWRSYIIPLLAGADLQQLKLFVRGEKEPKNEGEQEKKRDIRFVIEVEFSKLGPFQFDGLSREKTIDLMVRTRDALSEGMHDEIREIFANAISALGFTGTINFQKTLVFELNPTQEIHASQSGFAV